MAMIESEMRATGFERSGVWLYLDEVMHRVLNDYTAMLSTVRLASLRVGDSESSEALDEVTSRLNASASAFRALSPPADRSPRFLDEELEALCASLSVSNLAGKGIRLTFAADPVRVSAQRCWKILLIVSELITNAVRHAFLGRESGAIVVRLSTHANMLHCMVIDDGSASARVVPGRGSAILNGIAAELDGTIMRKHTAEGSAVVLQVPIAEHGAHSLQLICGDHREQH
jgi:two-component sensor histidine kinase